MKTLWLGLFAATAISTSAYAGCVGVSVGDPCIGIPTPEREREHVIIEHRHQTPMVVERRRREPQVFEHHYDHEYEVDE